VSFANGLMGFVVLNLLIAVAWLSLVAIKAGLRWKKLFLSSQEELRLHYALLLAVLALTLAHPFLPKPAWYEPPLKVWSAPSLKTFGQVSSSPQNGYLSLSWPRYEKSPYPVDHLQNQALLLLLALGGFALFHGLSDFRKMYRIRNQSVVLRSLHGVRILAHPTLGVPVSYWTPGTATVVIPEALVSRPLDLKMALAHELQHHRQNDTKWVYGIALLRVFCFPNPALRFWIRYLSELQEFACDETLVDQNKVKPRQYARCLLEVAETTLNQKGVPACATGLTFLAERKLLTRRIEKMFTQPSVTRRLPVARVAGLLIALLTITSFASQGLIRDRRITLSSAEKLADTARARSAFPIMMNERVLAQLNRFVGTPEGREFIQQSMARMQNYLPLIRSKLAEYQVPEEILAVPIIESGFQNLPPNNQQGWGAGLWMFIRQTARRYGLRVDAEVDERLNVAMLTDAAMRLLKADYLQFKDWQLAVMAYNMGEGAVQEGIRKTGSRDPWVLINQGFENDSDYLAKLMAAIIILKSPELLKS